MLRNVMKSRRIIVHNKIIHTQSNRSEIEQLTTTLLPLRHEKVCLNRNPNGPVGNLVFIIHRSEQIFVHLFKNKTQITENYPPTAFLLESNLQTRRYSPTRTRRNPGDLPIDSTSQPERAKLLSAELSPAPCAVLPASTRNRPRQGKAVCAVLRDPREERHARQPRSFGKAAHTATNPARAGLNEPRGTKRTARGKHGTCARAR